MTVDETIAEAAAKAEMRDLVSSPTDSMGTIGALLFNSFNPHNAAKQTQALNTLRIISQNPQTYEDKNQSL